ncbi:MAG TPA: 4Fe-4S dicluster domain-containing protein [Ignisphaera sp.]|uniref:4Fe-4S dicluster domain-containing protein n=1 Tax=Ignisphaera aggregans TaxID=334771 RepID=A0A832YXA3_9CREN|nr:4Fe-4S dicluster domain-containing protein [Ignisphaera sp.]HIP56681.1 4Fe-4S dicluster domain-containing protein [Ignisphaera aggregans]
MQGKQLPKWNEIPPGGAILEPGNSVKRPTGDWRTFRPIIDKEKCVRCLLCWVYCPDAAIKIIDEPYRTASGKEWKFSVEVDYTFCKGCGICVEECPVKAIEFVEEVK